MATGPGRRCGVTQGKRADVDREKWRGGPVMEKGSQRAEGEQRCLGDDCRSSRWSRPFSLTYTPGFTIQKQWVEVGTGGCGRVQSTSPGDHQRPAACLPSCLSECRSVPSITNKGLLFNKIQTQTAAHAQAHRHRENTSIQKYTSIEACKGKERGNKGQAVPPSVFIKEKSDQIN